MSDIAELRKLLAEPNAQAVAELVFALPGLLDENDRLVSKLALSERANGELNQSITEYEKRIAVLEAENNEVHGHLYDAAKACSEAVTRIAELKAALRFYAKGENSSHPLYTYGKTARAALGKKPAE